MNIFLDTARLKDISWATQAGLIDGITTNPSLLAKQAGDLDPKDVLKEICSLVEGPVSAEVVAVDVEGMLKEGTELAKIAENIVVKIDRKSTRLNSSHLVISYAVFCLKKKKKQQDTC